MTTHQLQELISNKCMDLCEHCNAVQIMATVINEDGSTTCIKQGWGDWYSRQGMAQEFIKEDNSRTAARELGEVINPPESF